MELRRLETTAGDRRSGRRSVPTPGREISPVQASLQWVTARIPPALVREIEAHAKPTGTTRSEAIRECLSVGIETIRQRDGVPGGRVEELLGAIESIRLLLELLGPPTFGTQRLLAPCASGDGTPKVSPQDRLPELRNASAA